MLKYMIYMLSIAWCLPCAGQLRLTGFVYEKDNGDPVGSATIRLNRGSIVTVTDNMGAFALTAVIRDGDTLSVRHVGFLEARIPLRPGQRNYTVYLESDLNTLEEVEVNTGYYQMPKERATGSFTHVDSKQLNRAMGANILQRLEGLVPGVQFLNSGGGSATDIRVRGLSTIESDETPLIVLDNFPYEGSIGNIDPNTIESVTVLKDAAAASIWGARAGNGVIVITTKKPGADGRMHISLNSNFNVGERPDLTYAKDWLPSETVMDIEKRRYALGHYTFADNQTTRLYVDYLKQHSDGELSDDELKSLEQTLRATDTRKEAMEHLYRRSGFQQYALNVAGAGERYGYNITAGYHGSNSDVVGNGGRRMNLGVRNRFSPGKFLDVGMAVDYVGQRSASNGIPYSGLSQGGRISPYLRLRDDDGAALAVPVANLRPYYAAGAEASGLLDWLYRPLEERDLHENTSFSQELRLNGDLAVKPLDGLTFKAIYQYVAGKGRSESHYLKESYYVRNLVNTFTQANGAYAVPYNGILRTAGLQERYSHFGRGQLDYQAEFGERHSINALAGIEVRHSQMEQFPASVLYNYEADYLTGNNQYNFNQTYTTRPAGTSQRIPGASANHRLYINRDLSYFANASYGFDKRYVLSGSMRWDGSNLFGVKTNQKGVPLWSVGGSWNVSNEAFYPQGGPVPYLRVRATYGVAGNVNKTITHYPTIRFSDSYIGLTAASLVSIGNPSLRWERVNTLNMGMDWRISGGRLSGTVEYFGKMGNDLIGNDYMDPTTGVSDNYKINYANIKTTGWDVQLNSKNLQGQFSWNTVLISSWVENEITNYRTTEDVLLSEYFHPTPPPAIGRSRDAVYAIPWNGLSSETGLPIILMDGQPGDDYQAYYQQYLEPGMLNVMGTTVPTWYGSLRNTVAWKGLEASAMLTWKSGYVFRRKSMEPSAEYSENYHADYYKRWEKPGDERHTDVPRHIPMEDASQYLGVSAVYEYAEALIEKGDHIRIQDVSISYRLPGRLLAGGPFRGVRVYGYARNLGILWRANRDGIDPDFATAQYRAPKTYSVGVQLDF